MIFVTEDKIGTYLSTYLGKCLLVTPSFKVIVISKVRLSI